MLLARNDDYSGICDCLLNKKMESVLHRYTEIPCSIVIWNTHRNINKFKECQSQDDWVTWKTVLFCCKYVLCGVLYEQLHPGGKLYFLGKFPLLGMKVTHNPISSHPLFPKLFWIHERPGTHVQGQDEEWPQKQMAIVNLLIIQSSEHSTTATKSHMLFERIQSFSTGLSLVSHPVIMLYEGIQGWRT